MYLPLQRGEGRGKEREQNIDVREKHRSAASCLPQLGPNLQATHVPQPGIEPVTFWFARQRSTN